MGLILCETKLPMQELELKMQGEGSVIAGFYGICTCMERLMTFTRKCTFRFSTVKGLQAPKGEALDTITYMHNDVPVCLLCAQ